MLRWPVATKDVVPGSSRPFHRNILILYFPRLGYAQAGLNADSCRKHGLEYGCLRKSDNVESEGEEDQGCNCVPDVHEGERMCAGCQDLRRDRKKTSEMLGWDGTCFPVGCMARSLGWIELPTDKFLVEGMVQEREEGRDLDGDVLRTVQDSMDHVNVAAIFVGRRLSLVRRSMQTRLKVQG